MMKDFTAKEKIFLLDIMIGNLWLFLDRTSLYNIHKLDTFISCASLNTLFIRLQLQPKNFIQYFYSLYSNVYNY